MPNILYVKSQSAQNQTLRISHLQIHRDIQQFQTQKLKQVSNAKTKISIPL